MERQNQFIWSVLASLAGALILLELSGVVTYETYLFVIVVAYFANSFMFRPRRRTVDVAGIGLLIVLIAVVASRFV